MGTIADAKFTHYYNVSIRRTTRYYQLNSRY